MQTWLDGFAQHMVHVACTEAKYPKDFINLSYTEQLNTVATNVITRSNSLTAKGLPDDERSNMMLTVMLIVSEFILNKVPEQLSAVKVSPDLAMDFACAKAPSISLEELGVTDGMMYYFDVPDNTLEADGLFVQALLCVAVSGKLMICATANRGKDLRVLQWVFDGERPATAVKMAAYDNIENFIALLLLYRTTIQATATTTDGYQLNLASLNKLSNKKRAAKLKKGSIFSFKVLNAPSEGMGRVRKHRTLDDMKMSGSWEVNAHYRYQPCGVGRKDRKLIWIDKFIKGEGKIKTNLTII